MRKLRSDITLKEAETWVKSIVLGPESHIGLAYIDLTRNIRDQTPYLGGWHYPDSFYEQPPAESFGEFWRPNRHSIWGHLLEYNSKNGHHPYLCEDGIWYKTFAPGLPADVDENGYPEDK